MMVSRIGGKAAGTCVLVCQLCPLLGGVDIILWLLEIVILCGWGAPCCGVSPPA